MPEGVAEPEPKPRRWSRRKKVLVGLAAAAIAGVVGVFLATWLWTAPAEAVPEIIVLEEFPARTAPEGMGGRPLLRVMTLNIAHGRGLALNQALVSDKSTRGNLDAVGDVVGAQRLHVLALQEADASSIWSGRFDHVRRVSERAGMHNFVHGLHVRGFKLNYGTALASALPLTDAFTVTFSASPPTPAKGFVVAAVEWPGAPGLEADVVSVHLDFSRTGVRRAQVSRMVQVLSGRRRPLVVMGDFNSEWDWRDSAVRGLAERLSLQAWRPEAGGLQTFPATSDRLDWILISKEIEFVDCCVVEGKVSDHWGVVAELALRTAGD